MSDFTSISETYEHTSLVQKSASEVLIELLEIQEGCMILDLGCGTGHIAKLLRDQTNSTVIGVDPAAGMIEKAKKTITDTNISFLNLAADQLDFENSFDVIFCNSAFQWFKNPGPSLNACYKALKHGGRIGIQAPAKNRYCPNFIDAVDRVADDYAIGGIFKTFDAPWFFLDSADEYREVFERAGFTVKRSEIVEVKTTHSVDEVFKIFESGAAAGYLNQQYYGTDVTAEYRETFRKIVFNAFERQADDQGNIDLVFFRIYLIAEKG